MPEATLAPELEEVRKLQQALLQVALSPGEDAQWPSGRILIPPGHRAAFQQHRRGLLAYRELVRTSLWDPIEAVFPITRALVGEEAWAGCREGFLAAGSVESPHYRDIPATFVEWLRASQWEAQRWPCLLQLAHAELVEILVSCAPDPAFDPDLVDHPALAFRVRLHPSAHLLEYTFAVHQATVESPHPEPAPARLLAFRGPDDEYQLLELTPATSALLARSQEEPLGAAMAVLGLVDPEPVFPLLRDLHQRGAILGFMP